MSNKLIRKLKEDLTNYWNPTYGAVTLSRDSENLTLVREFENHQYPTVIRFLNNGHLKLIGKNVWHHKNNPLWYTQSMNSYEAEKDPFTKEK